MVMAIHNLIEEVHDRLRGRRDGKVADYQLGLHLYNQNPRSINTIRRSHAGSHRRSRRWRDATEAGILKELGSRIRVVHAPGAAQPRCHRTAADQTHGDQDSVGWMLWDGCCRKMSP
jgi:hypothetical protein